MSNISIATLALSHILDDFQVYTQISNVLLLQRLRSGH